MGCDERLSGLEGVEYPRLELVVELAEDTVISFRPMSMATSMS